MIDDNLNSIFRFVPFEKSQTNDEKLRNLETAISDSPKILVATGRGTLVDEGRIACYHPHSDGPKMDYQYVTELIQKLRKTDIGIFYLNSHYFPGFESGTIKYRKLSDIKNKSGHGIYFPSTEREPGWSNFYDSLTNVKSIEDIESILIKEVTSTFPRELTYGSFLENIGLLEDYFQSLGER